MTGAPDAIDHMNLEHADAVELYAVKLLGAAAGKWRVTAIDPDGAILAYEEKVMRLAFDAPVRNAADLREAFVALAQRARSI
jgi:putative heme iron utilization protein